MGEVLPRKTENTVYRYLTAISKLRLGILTEQGEGSVFFFSLLLFLARGATLGPDTRESGQQAKVFHSDGLPTR